MFIFDCERRVDWGLGLGLGLVVAEAYGPLHRFPEKRPPFIFLNNSVKN